MNASQVLHLSGPILTSRESVRPEAWVIGGRITFIRPTGAWEVTTLAGFVLPGLVDAHCHIGLGSHGEVSVADTEDQAIAERAAGALLLRDAGSPAQTRWIDDRADLPVIVRAGRHIARTGRYIRNYASEVEPESLVEEVTAQAAAGDGWVKLVGDWIDRDAGDLAPCWPADILVEAIAAAHQAGARVTAHCFSEASLPDLVSAGIDCIEHATGLTAELIPTFKESGVAIVPTLINIETFPSIASAAEGKFPTYAAHMRDLHARRKETVRSAYEAGIAIFAGTDAGGSLPHGGIGREILALHDAGLSARDALHSATWGAREWLGHNGIAEGAPANVVICREDPRVELRTLLDPSVVVLRGQVFA